MAYKDSSLARFADIPDVLMLLPTLAGVGYAVVVIIAEQTGLAAIFPSVFPPRVSAVAAASLSFGLGLILAGLKYRAMDREASQGYLVPGLFLIILAILVWVRCSHR